MKKQKTNNNIKKFKCLKKIKSFQIINLKININLNIIGEFRDHKDFKKRFSPQQTENKVYLDRPFLIFVKY